MAGVQRPSRPRRRRHAQFAALILAAGLALTACSKSSAGANTTAASSASSSGGSVVPGGASLKGKTVLLDIYDPESNTFFEPAIEGAKACLLYTSRCV